MIEIGDRIKVINPTAKDREYGNIIEIKKPVYPFRYVVCFDRCGLACGLFSKEEIRVEGEQ